MGSDVMHDTMIKVKDEVYGKYNFLTRKAMSQASGAAGKHQRGD